jgi:hypothetical protein
MSLDPNPTKWSPPCSPSPPQQEHVHHIQYVFIVLYMRLGHPHQ